MINLKQLRFFQELARQNSFSRAASICCVTQPTLSNAIAQLEENIEGKLFNRSTRKVKLTAFGKHLLPLAEAVLSAHEEFVKGARLFKNPETKILRIGLSPLIDMQLLTEVLEPFQNQHSDMEVFYKECFMDDLEHRMENETIDLAVMPKREMSIHFDTLALYSEPLYFLPNVIQGGYSGNRAREISLSEITHETVIVTAGGCGLRDTIRNLFGSETLSLNEYSGQAISYKIVEDWSELGIGAGILPKSKLSADNTNFQQLQRNNKTPAMIEYEVSYPRHRERALYINEFIQYLQDIAPQIIQGRAV